MGPLVPLLTVVCNVFNDADRLPRAVASALAGWNGPGLEIVVVDDGSTDDTGQVAENLAAGDDRLRIIHRGRNDGTPGAARNLGLDAARGEWVAFVDSDDEYLPGTLRRLVDRAREQDADVAAGAVARYNERTDQVTPLPATRYTNGGVGGLTPDSPLWNDTVAVGKVIRLSLLRGSGIRFPEGILYEDQPFTVGLWLAARRIATLDEVVYHWFVNNVEGGESITARRHEIENFHDRIAANLAIDARLVDRPDLAAAKFEKFVSHDLALYGKDLDTHDDEYRSAFLAAARDYLTELPSGWRDGLEQPSRLVVREIVDGPAGSAVAAALFAYRRRHVERPLARRAGGWWWPYRPAAESTADHDLTRLVAEAHDRGRSIRTVSATAVHSVGSSLRLRGTVLDGDQTLGAFSRMTVAVRDRDSRVTLARASTRLRAHGRFEVRLDLPDPRSTAAPTTAWDLKVTFANAFGRPRGGQVTKPSPVEVRASVELGPLGGGLRPYRTRNGNLSIKAAPATD